MNPNQSGASVKASMMEKTMQFRSDMAKKIKDEKKMENAKRLMAHVKYVHLGLKTRCHCFCFAVFGFPDVLFFVL